MEKQWRNRPPGMHTWRRRKTGDYGVRLREKQKVKRYYGVFERQFMIYFRMAERAKANTGDALLGLLERRLDNVVRRAGLTRTIWAARQMVAHGHVLVNEHKTDRPSFSVKPGDVVALRPRIHTLARDNMESMAGHIVPGWMDVNPAELTMKILAMPTPDEIPFDVNTKLIVEFYR